MREETLSFTDAAEEVLNRFGNRQTMHYRDITEKALSDGLISTSGLTPEATMYAQILTEIKRFERRGDEPRFKKHGKGIVGLVKWEPTGIPGKIRKANTEVRRKLKKRLLEEFDPEEFEALVRRVLAAIGFEDASVTPPSKDGGIDVRGTLVIGGVVHIKMSVQAKRWKNNVQAPTVQQLRGSIGTHEQGLIITTSDFSKGAREEAIRPDTTPIALMNGDQLIDLMLEHEIEVKRSSVDLFELDKDEME